MGDGLKRAIAATKKTRERIGWDSYMVVNKNTNQWEFISGNKDFCDGKAKDLGEEYKVIPVEIRAKRERA